MLRATAWRRPLAGRLGLAVHLLCLFLLVSASAAAVEEGPPLVPAGAADKWCHATAFVNFNTWRLLVNLGEAIINGEKTLTMAETIGVEESARYRLRKTLYDASIAHKELRAFVGITSTPANNVWAPEPDVPDIAPPSGKSNEDGIIIVEDMPHERKKHVVPCVAVAIGIAGVAAAALLGTAAYTLDRIVKVEYSVQLHELQLHTIREETARYMAQSDLSIGEIEKALAVHGEDIR